MKPFKEIVDEAIDIPIEEVTAILLEGIDEAPAMDAETLLRMTLQYVEDCTRYSIALSLDVAETLGALSDGRESADDRSDAVLDYIRAAALYRAVEEREG